MFAVCGDLLFNLQSMYVVVDSPIKITISISISEA